MREILFRGRRSWGNKKWVEGDLLHGYNGYVGITKKLLGIETWQVEPETVGQYTGLTDKNGNKIFEGDILSASKRNGVVVWHDDCGGYCVKHGFNGRSIILVMNDFDVEVIGNIHDNPELLK